MKKNVIAVVFICFIMISCKKGLTDQPQVYSVEVSDFITRQPIEGAKIYEIKRTDFSWSCLCYLNRWDSIIGFTNNAGAISGLSSVSRIHVYKDGYFQTENFLATYHYKEKAGNIGKFRLFKRGKIEVNPNPTQVYDEPEPKIEIAPVLTDGSTKEFGFPIGVFSSSPYFLAVVGDNLNRVVVTRKNAAGTKDTLFKRDVFVPANVVVPVTVTY